MGARHARVDEQVSRPRRSGRNQPPDVGVALGWRIALNHKQPLLAARADRFQLPQPRADGPVHAPAPGWPEGMLNFQTPTIRSRSLASPLAFSAAILAPCSASE